MTQINASADSCRPSKKYLVYGSLLSILIGVVAFAPIWVRNGGRLMEYGDYFPQYVPFLLELKRMVTSGSLGWSWNSFLGDSFISAYSYYTVFNPFAWFAVLFPESCILYATMLTALLKLAVSTVGAMLYLRMFCRKDSYALIGALLYTFSGFTLVNTSFYFFQDVISVFPFLLYGLELLIRYNKRWIYIVALTLNAAINIYFFVSTVILVVLYVVFRLELYKISAWKAKWPVFVRIVFCSIFGTGIAGIALFPSLYAILGSGKATSSFGDASYVRMFSPQDLLERLRTLVAPIESNTYHAFYDCSSWCSIAAYIPIFGCLYAADWCFRKRDWLQKLCILLILCYFIPGLNSVFNLFTAAHYSRWLYGWMLLISLMTVCSLEEAEETGRGISKTGLILYSLLASALILLPTAANLLCRFGICVAGTLSSACESQYFFGNKIMVFMVLLTALNYLALWYLSRRPDVGSRKMLLCVVMACAVNYCAFNQLNYDSYYQYHYNKALVEGTENQEMSYTYRIDHPKQILNYSLFKNMPAVHNYNSLQNFGSAKFAVASGYVNDLKTVFLTIPEDSREPLDALLSVKYFMDYDGNADIPDGFTYQETVNNVAVYENENYLPMGFVYDSYCLQEDLAEMEPQQRAMVMLASLVISESDEAAVSQVLPRASDISGDISLTEVVADRRKTTSSFFEGTSSGFSAQIQLEDDNIVFFSIPMDSGWEITVNGEPAEILEVHYGLLGIRCGSGENRIEATYHTKGLNPGIGCSLLSLFACTLWCWLPKRKAGHIV